MGQEIYCASVQGGSGALMFTYAGVGVGSGALLCINPGWVSSFTVHVCKKV